MSQSHFFKANAGIKDIIGRELIYSDNIAIIELVKNSKDARASKARIEFIEEELLSRNSTIIIADDGKGMTLTELDTKWLNIAYSEKKKSLELLAGNKGVGRFSCDRLGEKLDLYTKHKNGDYIHLEVNWKDFEDKEIDDEVSSIPVEIKILPKEEFIEATSNLIPTTGTLLRITKLRSSWQTKKMNKLIDELEKFSPTLNQGFYVELYSKNRDIAEKVNKKINNNIFEKLEFKSTYIKSNIDKDGKYIFSQLFFQGEQIYEYKVINPYSLLKNIEIEIHFLDTISKKYFTQKVGGVQPIEYGSIFLFYNGFRISPYGNRGNDWLGINQRKTQGTARYFGTRDLIGKVFITDTDSSFSVLSNREGLANTATFHQLTSYDNREQVSLSLLSGENKFDNGYLISIIRQLETFVVDGLDWNRFIDTHGATSSPITTESLLKEPTRFKLQNISPDTITTVAQKLIKSNWAIEENNFRINKQALLKIQNIAQAKYDEFLKDFSETVKNKEVKDLSEYEQKKVIKIIEDEQEKAKKAEKDRDIAQKQHAIAEKKAYEATKKVETQEKTIEQINSQNMFLCAISNKDADSLLNLMHKTIDDILTVKREINYYTKRKFQGKEITLDEIDNIFDIIRKKADSIHKVAQFATYGNYKVATDVVTVDVIKCIKDYIKFLQNEKIYRNNFQITINCPDELSLIRAIRPLNLTIMLDNIFANALKAQAHEIEIDIKKEKNQLRVQFSDDGNGLAQDADADLIFSKGYTFTKGSGLGLYFVKSFLIEELDADISVIKVKKGFTLEVKIPCN